VDDTGAYGVGLADAYQAQAAKRGMQVMGRDRVEKGGVYERSRRSDLTLDSPCRRGCRGPAPKMSPTGLERASSGEPA